MFKINKYDYVDIHLKNHILEDCIVKNCSKGGFHIVNVKEAIEGEHNPLLKIFIPRPHVKKIVHKKLARLMLAANSPSKLIRETIEYHSK